MSTDLTADDIVKACAPKSDQLNADDLLHGPIVVTIRGLKGVASEDGKQPVAINVGDPKKPWKPCKTVMRQISHAWGPDPRPWIGRSLLLWRDPEVTYGGVKQGGIRIREMSHIPGPIDIMLTTTRGKKERFHVDVLRVDAPKPVTVPTWATEGEAALTDEQLGEVVAFLGERKTPIEKVEAAMGARDTWTAATVRGIYGRFQPSGGAK